MKLTAMDVLKRFGVDAGAVAQCAARMGLGDESMLKRAIESNGQDVSDELKRQAAMWRKDNHQRVQQTEDWGKRNGMH